MDREQMIAQHNAIKSNLRTLTDAVEAYSSTFEKNISSDDLEAVGQISQCQVAMVENVKQMQSAIYGPLNMVMLHYEECLRSSSVRTLLEMGVFDALPVDGSGMSAPELAKKLGVDENLLVRLMRVVVPTFFEEPQPEVYTHTANSKVYLDGPLRANFKMMFDEICVASTRMPDFFKKNGYLNPISRSNNPYTFAHDTHGLSMFEFLLQHPDRFNNFNDAMQARSSQTSLPYSLFPFKSKFGEVDTTNETVLLVDVGSGIGQATLAIREACAEIKGKMVMQDQKQVIDGIATPLPPGVEAMAHDFFKPQPVQGALFYYIHRCLHDWPDSDCLVILQHLAAAMSPNVSRLLISEIE
ncbi:O-methyltransferase [Pochonia chlamydosporia 170]|uniref:O-methyltransferase n=1 Tax=Pochonia chlamydosporia 170 TaxID=1380566 RepID=A0A179FI49_METCM|nr:O-methyltransferase [Pochonia chlamydosporia 170]OAQ65236.2 O-methyltransferase [Pochonia chlamydosporia 170]